MPLIDITAGVDEAGRGPLAGPVVSAAVILDPQKSIVGLADSKKLSARKREALAVEIRQKALAWSVAWSDVHEVDSLNILHATLLSMRRALLGLRLRPQRALVDGNRLPDLNFGGHRIEGEAIIGGDDKVDAISAASILAKVRRDAIMQSIDKLYPGYGFARPGSYQENQKGRRLKSWV